MRTRLVAAPFQVFGMKSRDVTAMAGECMSRRGRDAAATSFLVAWAGVALACYLRVGGVTDRRAR